MEEGRSGVSAEGDPYSIHELSSLNEWFGVTGKALDWFKSYVTGRCQNIKLGDCLSSKSQG